MAEAIVTVFTEEAARHLMDLTSSQLGYIWNCTTNFKILKEELGRLEAGRVRVQHSVDEARRNGRHIETEVEIWFGRVNTLIDEVTKIISDYEQSEMKCLKSHCPNVIKRYQHGKKAASKLEDISKLYRESRDFKPGTVSYSNPPQEVWLPSSRAYEELESRTSILKQVMDALNRTDVTMVGIVGMGGVGKTTLARAVGKNAEDNKLFDSVVFVEVSHPLDDEKKIREIQYVIAGKLGKEKFNDDTPPGRARELVQRLKMEKTVLLILDNIWESLEWDKIGIPLNHDHTGCKVLLTSREVNILKGMDCHTNFPIESLNEVETWNLFKNVGGPYVESSDLGTLPSDVAKKCGGLPIAIVTVAKALKNSPLEDWKSALLELGHPSPDDSFITHDIYSSIKFSFNCLKSDMLKSILLLCCTMASISNDSIVELLSYSWGLSLLSGAKTLEEARVMLNQTMQRLKNSSLLLETSKYGSFSIHDVVRDVGRMIATQSEENLIAHDMRELRQSKNLKKFTSIFLVDVTMLPMELDCPHLRFLYLTAKTEVKVPHEFFEQMQELEVLNVEEMELSELSTSLLALVKLRTLILEGCSLRDMSTNGNIVSTPAGDAFPCLEILSLTDFSNLETICGVNVGPKSFCQLTRIRISRCHQLKNIFPLSIAKQLSLLEEIEVQSCDNIEEIFIADEAENGDIDQVFLEQLSSLTLKGLRRLKRICSGGEVPSSSNALSSEIGVEEDQSLFGEKGLSINQCGVKEMVEGEGVGAAAMTFPSLKYIKLEYCRNLEFIFSDKGSSPNLYEIEFSSLEKLKKIWQSNVISEDEYITKLSKVTIQYCENLEYIFPTSIARNLSQLKVLDLDDCGVKEIVAGEGVEGAVVRLSFPELSCLSLRNLNQLRCFYPSENKIEFSKLKELNVRNCEKMVGLFSSLKHDANDPILQETQAFTHLEKMILDERQLISIYSSPVSELVNHFPRLKYLQVFNLHSDALLHSIWEKFHILEELEINSCSNREIFPSKGVGKQAGGFAVLKEVLPPSSFKSLKILKVFKCYQMKSLMSVTTAKSLVVLEEMSIRYCDKVAHIIEGGEDVEDEVTFKRLKSMEFGNLDNLISFYDGKCTFNFLLLEKLKVVECPSLMLFSLGAFKMPNFQQLECESTIHNCKDHELNRLMRSILISSIRNQSSLSWSQLKLVQYYFPECIKDLSSLEQVILKGNEIEMCQNHLSEFILSELKCISVSNDESMAFSNKIFGNLKIIKVYMCNRLESLMTASTARSLEQLEELGIQWCSKMRQVVTDEEADRAKDKKITFPKLKKLELYRLAFLTSFINGNCPLEFPVLDTLWIRMCPSMDIFTLGSLRTPELRKVTQDWEKDYHCQDNLGEIIRQHHMKKIFSRYQLAFKNIKSLLQVEEVGMEQVFSNLVELSFRRDDITWLLSHSLFQFPQKVFPELQCLDVYEDDSTSAFSLVILDRFHTVKRLKLNSNSYEEIFSSQDLQRYAKLFAQIKSLSLYGFDNLKQMWKHDSLLQNNIETLEVESCGSLETLMPPSSSFRNLTWLRVEGCDGMMNLFNPTVAKSLGNLNDLEIRNCKMMEEVLSSEEVVRDGEIIFSQLESLKLYNLSSLRSFCSQNYTFSFPYLHKFILKKCPKMKFFSSGVLNMPRLYGMQCQGTTLEVYDNLNTIMPKIHEKQNMGTSYQDCGGPSTLHSSTI